MTPHKTLLYHNPPCSASSGSSTNSASGFSSKVKEKNDPGTEAGWGVADAFDVGGGGELCVTVGDMFKNDLNPTLGSDQLW